ncbi:MAG: energy-coupling factor transporter transmembrane component T [Methermicoccaceae archaeon]
MPWMPKGNEDSKGSENLGRLESMSYRDKLTSVHSMPPAVKVIWALAVLFIALIFEHPILLLALFIVTAIPPVFGKVTNGWGMYMKLSLYFVPILIILNVLFNHNGSTILYDPNFSNSFFSPVITLESLTYGVMMCVRLITILSAFALITLTIHPDDIVALMHKAKVPSKSVLITSLSSRFMPTLIRDAEVAMEVQRTRGLELDKGSKIERLKKIAPLLIPLLANSLERSIDVAEAMEARGFGNGKRRSSYNDLPIGRMGWLYIILIIGVVGGSIISKIYGWGAVEFYPVFSASSSIVFPLIMILLMIVPFLHSQILFTKTQQKIKVAREMSIKRGEGIKKENTAAEKSIGLYMEKHTTTSGVNPTDEGVGDGA